MHTLLCRRAGNIQRNRSDDIIHKFEVYPFTYLCLAFRRFETTHGLGVEYVRSDHNSLTTVVLTLVLISENCLIDNEQVSPDMKVNSDTTNDNHDAVCDQFKSASILHFEWICFHKAHILCTQIYYHFYLPTVRTIM